MSEKYLDTRTAFFIFEEGFYGPCAKIQLKRSDHRVFTIGQLYNLKEDDLVGLAGAVTEAVRKYDHTKKH